MFYCLRTDVSLSHFIFEFSLFFVEIKTTWKLLNEQKNVSGMETSTVKRENEQFELENTNSLSWKKTDYEQGEKLAEHFETEFEKFLDKVFETVSTSGLEIGPEGLGSGLALGSGFGLGLGSVLGSGLNLGLG